jgi:hypothetical protein
MSSPQNRGSFVRDSRLSSEEKEGEILTHGESAQGLDPVSTGHPLGNTLPCQPRSQADAFTVAVHHICPLQDVSIRGIAVTDVHAVDVDVEDGRTGIPAYGADHRVKEIGEAQAVDWNADQATGGRTVDPRYGYSSHFDRRLHDSQFLITCGGEPPVADAHNTSATGGVVEERRS